MEPTTTSAVGVGVGGLPPPECIASCVGVDDDADSPTRGGGILPDFLSYLSSASKDDDGFTPPPGSVRLQDVKDEYEKCNAYTKEIRKILDKAQHEVIYNDSNPPNLIQSVHLLMALAEVKGTDAYEELERRQERQMIIDLIHKHFMSLSPYTYLGDVSTYYLKKNVYDAVTPSTIPLQTAESTATGAGTGTAITPACMLQRIRDDTNSSAGKILAEAAAKVAAIQQQQSQVARYKLTKKQTFYETRSNTSLEIATNDVAKGIVDGIRSMLGDPLAVVSILDQLMKTLLNFSWGNTTSNDNSTKEEVSFDEETNIFLYCEFQKTEKIEKQQWISKMNRKTVYCLSIQATVILLVPDNDIAMECCKTLISKKGQVLMDELYHAVLQQQQQQQVQQQQHYPSSYFSEVPSYQLVEGEYEC